MSDFTSIELEEIFEAVCFAAMHSDEFKKHLADKGVATSVQVAWSEGGFKTSWENDYPISGHVLIGKIRKVMQPAQGNEIKLWDRRLG